MDDAALAERARAGHQQAWSDIYDRYADRLHDYCWSILRDRDEAADALHETFIAAARGIGGLRDPERLRAWMYAIARNESLRRIKARSRVVPTEDVPEAAAMTEEADDLGREAEREELRLLVWDAAEGLAPRDRALLDLHLRQGLEGQELADAIGVTPNNAYVMLNRLRHQVERALGALLVARRGSKDCPELQTILAGWDGTLSPLIRKRVARHIDNCDECGKRRAALVSPLALLATMPLVPAPPGLRTKVLGSLIGAIGSMAGAAGTAGVGAGSAAGGSAAGGSAAGGGAAGAGAGAATSAVGPVLAAVAAAVVAVGVATAFVLTAVRGDDGDRRGASAARPPAAETTSTIAPAPPTSSAPPTSASAPPIERARRPSASEVPTTVTTTAPPTTAAAPAPELAVGTERLDFGFSRAEVELPIANEGTGALDWTLSLPTGFSASSTEGTLDPGADTSVAVTIDRSLLPEGVYTDTATVAGGETTTPIPITAIVDRTGPAGEARPPTAAYRIGPPICPAEPFQAQLADDNGVESVTLTVQQLIGPERAVEMSLVEGTPEQGVWQADVNFGLLNVLPGDVQWTMTGRDQSGNEWTTTGTVPMQLICLPLPLDLENAVESIGLDPQRQLPADGDALAVEVDGSGPVELEMNGGGAPLLDPGMGDVRTSSETTSGLEQVVEGETGVVGVEEPVVGMGTGGDVPVPQPLGVHGGEHATPPERSPGDEVGHEPMQPAVDEHRAQVDRHANGLG